MIKKTTTNQTTTMETTTTRQKHVLQEFSGKFCRSFKNLHVCFPSIYCANSLSKPIIFSLISFFLDAAASLAHLQRVEIIVLNRKIKSMIRKINLMLLSITLSYFHSVSLLLVSNRGQMDYTISYIYAHIS